MNKVGKIIVGVIIAIIVLLVIKNLGGSSSSKVTSYLPEEKSKYDAVCTKSTKENGIVIEEVYGIQEMKNYNYLSYTYRVIYSKADGSALDEAKNKEAIEYTKEGLKSLGCLSVDYESKEGKFIYSCGISNYQYSKASDAKKMFESSGYSCN